MRRRYINIFILIFFICQTISGQDSLKWPYQHIDRKAGLPNSSINTMIIDKLDFMWFGSWDGLTRYDGSTIQPFKSDQNKKGTISNLQPIKTKLLDKGLLATIE